MNCSKTNIRVAATKVKKYTMVGAPQSLNYTISIPAKGNHCPDSLIVITRLMLFLAPSLYIPTHSTFIFTAFEFSIIESKVCILLYLTSLAQKICF